MIHFPAPCPHRAILIIHDSPEKSTVRPMQNGSVLQDCKTPQRRGVPFVLPEKGCIIKASGTGRKPRDAPRESLSASVKEAKEEHCHGNFARDQPGAGGSGVLRLPGQRPYPGPAGGALTGSGVRKAEPLPSGQRRPAGAAAGPGHGGFRPGRDPAASVRRHQGLSYSTIGSYSPAFLFFYPMLSRRQDFETLMQQMERLTPDETARNMMISLSLEEQSGPAAGAAAKLVSRVLALTIPTGEPPGSAGDPPELPDSAAGDRSLSAPGHSGAGDGVRPHSGRS